MVRDRRPARLSYDGSTARRRADANDATPPTPPTARRLVRAVRGGQEVARGRVRDAGLVLAVPEIGGLVLEAIDATGAVIGTGGIADPASAGLEVDGWGED